MSQIMRRVLHSLLLLFAESTAFKNHFLKEQGRADSFQNTPEALLFLTVSVLAGDSERRQRAACNPEGTVRFGKEKYRMPSRI